MNPIERAELNGQLEGLLGKGFIRHIFSPSAVLILLTPKKDEFWRMCIYNQAINKIIVKYMFPIPKLKDMLNELSGAK